MLFVTSVMRMRNVAQPLPPSKRDKMEANSRVLSASPTLTEDSLVYCLELQGGILESVHQLDRALLEPRSAPPEMTAVEPQGIPFERPQLPFHGDDDDWSLEWTDGLSPSRSVSPSLSDSQPTAFHLLRAAHLRDSDLRSRRQTALERIKPLESNGRYGTLKADVADKYRLSFVDISDSSSDDEKFSQIAPMLLNAWQKIDTFTVQKQDTAEEAVVRNSSYSGKNVTSPDTQLEADLQYDDREISGAYNYHDIPTPHSLVQSTALDQRLPSATAFNPERKLVKDVVPPTTGRAPAVKSMDHASFSPLYTMSIPQLKHTVQLLETKLLSMLAL